MMDVFLLLVYLGTGEDRKLDSGNMHFYSIDRCNYFAKHISKRFGNYGYQQLLDKRDRVTSYCVPRNVDPKTTKVYP